MKKILIIQFIVSFAFVLWECLFFDHRINFFGGIFTIFFSQLLTLITVIIILYLFFQIKFKVDELKKQKKRIFLILIILGINLFGMFLCDGFSEIGAFITSYIIVKDTWPP